MGAESSNFAMNGPKNLSKSLYQKDRPFRAILDFTEKFQIFGILRLSNKFEDLKISSHFILLLNTSSKTICRKKNFGPISVEICCPEKMALNVMWLVKIVYIFNFISIFFRMTILYCPPYFAQLKKIIKKVLINYFPWPILMWTKPINMEKVPFMLRQV